MSALSPPAPETTLSPSAMAVPGPLPSRRGPAPLAKTASVTTFGHLAWIGWLWLATGVIVTGIVVAIGAFNDDGDLAHSVWQEAAAGWQRWPVLSAGVATTWSFAPLLVGNGVTRARLSASVAVTMVVLAVLGAAFIAAGYLIEGVVFDRNGWSHVLDAGGRTLDARMVGGLAVRHTLTLAGYFVSGWLIGIGFYRFGREAGIPLILPSIVPIVLVELLLLGGGAGVVTRPFGDASGPPLAVGAPAAAAVIAVATVAATRYTRGLALGESRGC
jgi:hypothetical protein